MVERCISVMFMQTERFLGTSKNTKFYMVSEEACEDRSSRLILFMYMYLVHILVVSMCLCIICCLQINEKQTVVVDCCKASSLV